MAVKHNCALAEIYRLFLLTLVISTLLITVACGNTDNASQSKSKLEAKYNTSSTTAVTGYLDSTKLQQTTSQPTTQTTVATSQGGHILSTITSVVDGDTIRVAVGTQIKTIRLIGIDTPETKDPRKPVQCFGNEATNRMNQLVENKQVYLESDPTQGELDKYGRLLRYVILPDGSNVNLQMISDGYAFEYTYRVPYKYQSEFKAAQRDADLNQRGLWASSTCNGNVTQPAVTGPSNIPSNTAGSGVVKKSNTGICHGPGTTYYEQTKNYTSFKTIQECLDSGGRMPKR